MSKQVTITLDDWVFNQIESERTAKGTSRSEYIQEHLIKGLQSQ